MVPKNIQNPQQLAAGVVRPRPPLGSVPGVTPYLERAPSRVTATRAPACAYVAPFPAAAVVSGAVIPVRVLPENLNRVAAVLRNTVPGTTIFYGGPGGRLPAAGVGIPAFGTETLTLETTDEIWVIQTAGPNASISGIECVALDTQAKP